VYILKLLESYTGLHR